MRVQLPESLATAFYKAIATTEATYRELAAKVDAVFDARVAGSDQERANRTADRTLIEAGSRKLLTAYFADAIDLSMSNLIEDRIRAGLANIDHNLAEHDGPDDCGRIHPRQTPAVHQPAQYQDELRQ